MPKQVQKDNPREEPGKLSFLDGDSTIRSSGLFNDISAFIPTLTFLSGPVLGKEIPLVHRQLTFGRGSDCDIMIADPSVSRKHLQICCTKVLKSGEKPALKVVLRDLGSRNGTLVNYASVRRAVLKPGDKILLGKVILKFEHRDIAEQSFYEELYRLATADSLTSLLNKGTILRCLSEELAESQRNRRRVSLVLADIDGFKSINDLFGHLVGDRVLLAVANLFRDNLRRRDKVGRVGGDEFLILLPETSLKGAAQCAERIRTVIAKFVGSELGLFLSVTASFGIASSCAHAISAESLLDQADLALYRAKALGRNRTEIWKPSMTLEGVRNL